MEIAHILLVKIPFKILFFSQVFTYNDYLLYFKSWLKLLWWSIYIQFVCNTFFIYYFYVVCRQQTSIGYEKW